MRAALRRLSIRNCGRSFHDLDLHVALQLLSTTGGARPHGGRRESSKQSDLTSDQIAAHCTSVTMYVYVCVYILCVCVYVCMCVCVYV